MWGTTERRRRHRPRPWDDNNSSSGALLRRHDDNDGRGVVVVVNSTRTSDHANDEAQHHHRPLAAPEAAVVPVGGSVGGPAGGDEAPLSSTASVYYGAVDAVEDAGIAGSSSAVASEHPQPPEEDATNQHTQGADRINSNNTNNDDDESENNRDENENDDEYHYDPNDDVDVNHHPDEAVGLWTRRVRCFFALLTWPVVPLGTFAALSLLWMLVAGFVLDVHKSCAHSMHPYVVASVAIAAYLPYHTSVRARLGVVRGGATAPNTTAAAVRRCDQCVRTLVLLYVYGGVTLLQTCHDDQPDSGGADGGGNNPDPSHLLLNACAATCPHLYSALAVYVAALELLVLSLLLPLLCLPCLYLWVLRQVESSGPVRDANGLDEWRVDHDDEAFPLRRRGEYPFFLYGGGRGGSGTYVAADDILALLEPVKLVATTTTTNTPVSHTSSTAEHDDNDDDDFGGAFRVNDAHHDDDAIPQVFVVLPRDGPDDVSLGIPVPETARSCCICLSDFPVVTKDDGTMGDLEAGGCGVLNNDSDDVVVRTPQCQHLFHGRCIATWVGGRWPPPPRLTTPCTAPTPGAAPPQRRARRTTCPLCRKDLRRSSRRRSSSIPGDGRNDDSGDGGDTSS